jgi:hypothetical protein
MKTLTVRLPEELAAQIEAESRERKISKSDVIRERLSRARPVSPRNATLDKIGDLIGSVHGLPSDLSTNKKKYLKAGYGQKHSR